SMKSREFREETLSARNRLFKLLTSPTLDRVMGLSGHSINLSEIIEQGNFLLVNLAPSDYLSHENAAVFGALLVNEFFECAMRRRKQADGRDPSHAYLQGRGISRETAEKFGVGFFSGKGSMSGRVVIPIQNEAGELVAYA